MWKENGRRGLRGGLFPRLGEAEYAARCERTASDQTTAAVRPTIAYDVWANGHDNNDEHWDRSMNKL
jgi:hypothetical protein